MPSPWSRLRRRPSTPDVVDADLTKAAVAGPRVLSVTDAADLLRAVASTQQVTTQAPLVRDPLDQLAFGPGHPLFPQAIDPPRKDTGRAEPRLFEYPVSWNLPGITDRLVPWKVLRDFADNVPLVRRCIEIRKAEVVSLDWTVRLTKEAVNAALRDDPTKSKSDVEKTLRDKYEPQIARAVEFWRTPDRGNGLEFTDWIVELLEEHFVLDAIALYPRRTFGGDLFSLEILDGSTIKPLLDYRGGRPLPPHPAYQQILTGFPRGEFVATTEPSPGTEPGVVRLPGAYPADQLIYKRRNVRAFTPYGYSAVEQALLDGDLYLRRHGWMRAEYTDGVGGRLLEVQAGSEASSWTPAQLREYEAMLNDLLSGQTAERRKFKVLPPGLQAADAGDNAERYKPDYDLHLIKLLAGHFETTSTELGFAETSGLGGVGFHEGQSDVQDRKGTRPTLVWLASLLTSVMRTQLGIPDVLEFAWHGLDSEDEAAADAVMQERVNNARMTLNEARDEIGQPRYDFPEADMPMLITGRGVVFLEGASESAAPGQEIGPQQAVPTGGVPGVTGAGVPASAGAQAPAGQGKGQGAPAAATPPSKAPQKPALSKADELGALARYQAKNRTRPFETATLTEADVLEAGLDPTRVLFKTDGEGSGDAGGRPDGRRTGGLEGVPALRADLERGGVLYRPGT